MDEFDLIRAHFAPLAQNAGAASLDDDVAELDLSALGDSGRLIITQDAIVEGLHFFPDDPIGTVAKKLVRVNVSDIIAKGARPHAALLSLIWPKGRPMSDLTDFARALGDDLAKWKSQLIGGDTTSTPGPLTLSLTLTGIAGPRGPIRRAGAQPGDDVWVSGVIGDGWMGLQAAAGTLGPLSAEASNALTAAYRIPNLPPLFLADIVAAYGHASIDVSDGLVADAEHIARTSGVAMSIDAASVPLSPAATAYVTNGKAPLAALLTGGDDYQTLFTAPAAARVAIEAAIRPPLSLTRIGQTAAGAGVRILTPDGSEMTLQRRGWSHFG